MKIPKNIKRYCKFCKKHTLHKITQAKTGTKRGSLKWGSIERAKKRSVPGTGNKGRWGSKPTSPKRTGAKISKKPGIRYTCTVCNKTKLQKSGARAKRVEIK